MSEGVFLGPRIAGPADQNCCRQFAQTTVFGAAGIVIANKPGRLYKLTAVNTSSTGLYIQIFDKGIAPVANDLPIWERALTAQASGPDDIEMDFGLSGLGCAIGISIALSTTGQKLTLATSVAHAFALYAATVAAPIVTSLTPTSGTSAGGTAVTITGSGFGGATSGTIGGVALTSFVVVSDTSITAVTGAHAVGATDVIITNPTGLGGASAALRSAFTYT